MASPSEPTTPNAATGDPETVRPSATMAGRDVPSEMERWFGENLRDAREERRISQTQLARRMSELGFAFHQTTVSRIEAGERPVRLPEAVMLADQLGTTINELMHAPDAFQTIDQLNRATDWVRERLDVIARCTKEVLDARPNLRHLLAKGRRLEVDALSVTAADHWLHEEPEDAVRRGRAEAGVEKTADPEVIEAGKLLGEMGGGIGQGIIRRLGPEAEEQNAFRRLASALEMSGEERRLVAAVAKELDARRNRSPEQWDRWLEEWISEGVRAELADRKITRLWSNLEFWVTRGTPASKMTPENISALRKLSVEQRHAVVLHYGAELAGPQIAEIMQISERHVKQAMEQGMRQLYRSIEEADRKRYAQLAATAEKRATEVLTQLLFQRAGREGRAVQGFTDKDLVAALNELPERQRDAVVLRYLKGMPLEDVATTLEISTSTASSELRRGTSALRNRLVHMKGGD